MPLKKKKCGFESLQTASVNKALVGIIVLEYRDEPQISDVMPNGLL